MSLRKLPNDFQTIIRFCNQITRYKRAVEELVYNSLDAKATSIAVRMSIDKNTIQVIDNGCGVKKNDFVLLGQKHATSKCLDLNALKSAPNKYGFRGQSLAGIIEVSHSVKITSRHENSEETWVKTFDKGREKDISGSKQRPSKGTTMEIKGFLYNLNIQKKSVDALAEINDIKNLLEQLSLVHTNASFSLRDDDKNEIIFKIHKNRDMYQTLSSLYGIKKEDIQELKVEKNQYKVAAFIGKKDREVVSQHHWLFLNGKIIHNTKLNNIVNDSLSKSLRLNIEKKKKLKTKNFHNNDDNEISHGKIPFYLIFVSCPYYDYDISCTPKQSVLEFKSWEQIRKILEKLVKFYVGNENFQETKQPAKLKEITNPVKNQGVNKEGGEVKERIKTIMEKILGSNVKKPGVSQMQNGIKGKLAKRKAKKTSLKVHLSRVLAPHKNTAPGNSDRQDSGKQRDQNPLENLIRSSDIPLNQEMASKKVVKEPKRHNEIDEAYLKRKAKESKAPETKPLTNKVNKKKTKHKQPKLSEMKKNKIKKTMLSTKKKLYEKKRNKSKQGDQKITPSNSLLSRFEQGCVKRRCNMLAKHVDEMLNYKKQRKRKIFINEKVQYSSVIKDNKNVSVRKKIGEIVIHDYIPLPPRYSPCSFDNRVWDGVKKKQYKSTYDLVQTILKTQQTYNDVKNTSAPESVGYPTDNYIMPATSYSPQSSEVVQAANLPRLTYNSHHYGLNQSHVETAEDYHYKNQRFISTQSKDNFIVPSPRHKRSRDFNFKKPYAKSKSAFDFHYKESLESITIDFSTSKKSNSENIEFNKSINDLLSDSNRPSMVDQYTYTLEEEENYPPHRLYVNDETYTVDIPDETQRDALRRLKRQEIEENDVFTSRLMYEIEENAVSIHDNTGIVETPGMRKDNNNVNVVFVSESQDLVGQTSEELCQPIELCEIVHSGQVEDSNIRVNELYSIPHCGRKNDSLFMDEFDLNSSLLDRDAFISAQREIRYENNNINNVSRHFGIDKDENETNVANHEKDDTTNNPKSANILQNSINKKETFQFKNRLRFVPKGMSPIFENCQTKNVCDYNLDKDYYEKTLYNEFANNVQINSEMLQPDVQNIKELTTKEIQKVNYKLKKDNASLVFDADSLKSATVLAQVDEKFIAAKIKGQCYQSNEISEHLVLFDQHAVHERIRLEKNLADYMENDHWKSTTLDGIVLKLSKEDLVYLHNYKDKFAQFGLDWTVLGGKVLINAIPQAVLGKHTRQVEVIMKAVKNIISEEISAIKSQKGCVSLYPKSIMELVFSEACRYSIKFGDRLSKSECIELLDELSECKTPFQCAHGRPVMAVLMDLKKDCRSYMIDKSKLSNFAAYLKKKNKP